MKKRIERRVNEADAGGTRRHDDPPAWMDKTLSLEKRRVLLDRAIKQIGQPKQDGGPSPKDRK